MASASGQQTKLGIKKATLWGTAVACGAGNGVEILPSGIKRTAETLRNDSLGGKSFTSGLDMGAIKAEGGYKAYLRYVGHDLPLALVFGATGGTPTQQGWSGRTAVGFRAAAAANSCSSLYSRWCVASRHQESRSGSKYTPTSCVALTA